jgi:hypothetical protein
MADTILFDKLAYIDRLKRAGIDENQARAHAETKIDLAVRDMTIRTGAMLIALFAALASIKFFG